MGWRDLGSPQEEIWGGIGVILRNMGWRGLGSPEGFGDILRGSRTGWRAVGSSQEEIWDEEFGVILKWVG